MIIPVGFAQLSFLFDGAAAPEGAEVVIGVENVASVNASALAAVGASAWSTNILPRQNQHISLAAIRCKLGPNTTGADVTVAVGDPGSITGSEFPPQVAALVRKSTALGGREGRGRMYVPGLSESDSAGAGLFDNTIHGLWVTALNDFLGDMQTGDAPLVILHNSATAPTSVTDLVVDLKFATQRRRLR